MSDATQVPVDRIVQYTRRQIAGIWAAAALPVAALAWVVAPWLADQLDGPAALPRALLVTLTLGLVWQFLLVLLLVHRERGSLRWPVLKDALWLQAPRSPSTGRFLAARLVVWAPGAMCRRWNLVASAAG